MTDRPDRRSRIVDTARGLSRELASRIAHGMHERGYDEAAHLCLGLVGKHIEDLNQKVSAGEKLNPQEVYLLTRLLGLKSEMEKELQSSWDTNVPT